MHYSYSGNLKPEATQKQKTATITVNPKTTKDFLNLFEDGTCFDEKAMCVNRKKKKKKTPYKRICKGILLGVALIMPLLCKCTLH